MARGLNTIYLVGTLVQAPEMRYTQNGLAILELNLAGNDNVIGDDDRPRELAWYHRVTLFGAQAEQTVSQIEDGTPARAEGRINYRTWESQDGQKRSALDVNANRVEVLTMGPRGEDATVVDAKGQERLRNALNQVM